MADVKKQKAANMADVKKQINEEILNLTLEIIYLLTGEDYTFVKESGESIAHVGSWRSLPFKKGRQRPAKVPPPQPPIHQRDNDEKILELTHKIIQLLTGEVPIRCEDVAVYFSVEEWEYVEGHQDLYREVILKKVPPDPTDQLPVPWFCKDYSSPLSYLSPVTKMLIGFINLVRGGGCRRKNIWTGN